MFSLWSTSHSIQSGVHCSWLFPYGRFSLSAMFKAIFSYGHNATAIHFQLSNTCHTDAFRNQTWALCSFFVQSCNTSHMPTGELGEGCWCSWVGLGRLRRQPPHVLLASVPDVPFHPAIHCWGPVGPFGSADPT